MLVGTTKTPSRHALYGSTADQVAMFDTVDPAIQRPHDGRIGIAVAHSIERQCLRLLVDPDHRGMCAMPHQSWSRSILDGSGRFAMVPI